MSTPPEMPQDPLFFRHYAENEVALHTYVRSLLPTRQDAAEVMQQVMIALWQGYRQANDFRPWAFGVARNVALMHLRSHVSSMSVSGSYLGPKTPAPWPAHWKLF